jgi:type II secretory pathway pseudopilin PulG
VAAAPPGGQAGQGQAAPGYPPGAQPGYPPGPPPAYQPGYPPGYAAGFQPGHQPAAPPKSRTGLIVALAVGGGILILVLVILAAVALPLFTQQQGKAVDSSARANVGALAAEVATIYADASPDTEIAISAAGDSYRIEVHSSYGDEDITLPRTEGVDLQPSSHFEGPESWCIGVRADEGKVKDFAITARGGLFEGAVCDHSGGTATSNQ